MLVLTKIERRNICNEPNVLLDKSNEDYYWDFPTSNESTTEPKIRIVPDKVILLLKADKLLAILLFGPDQDVLLGDRHI